MGVAVQRLKRRAEFLRVAALRRKWAAPGLILQVAPALAGAAEKDSPPPSGGAPVSAPVSDPLLRVGFTCSKKVGNSVERNRAKRRLRAAAALILPTMAQPGHDYVLIGRTETLHRPFDLLLKDLQTALKRVGALSESGRAVVMSEGQPRP